MPFRTPAARQSEDVAYIRGPGSGLAEGEWVAYWAVFPHSLTGKVTSQATSAAIDPLTGRLTASFDAGTASMARVALGIVDWNLMDDTGTPVRWEPAKARELMDGLTDATFDALTTLIGNGAAAPTLTDPVDNLPNPETVGFDSGGSSSTS